MGGGRACGAGAGWEPCEPVEAGRRPRGAERSPAGGGEGGSRRRRRGCRPGVLREAELVPALRAERTGLGLLVVPARLSREP